MENLPEMVPNGARSFFPTNPDLADILGRTDLDFDIFYFLDFCLIPNFQISRFQLSKFPEIWPGAGLGLGTAWALGRAWDLHKLGLVKRFTKKWHHDLYVDYIV